MIVGLWKLIIVQFNLNNCVLSQFLCLCVLSQPMCFFPTNMSTFLNCCVYRWTWDFCDMDIHLWVIVSFPSISFLKTSPFWFLLIPYGVFVDHSGVSANDFHGWSFQLAFDLNEILCKLMHFGSLWKITWYNVLDCVYTSTLTITLFFLCTILFFMCTLCYVFIVAHILSLRNMFSPFGHSFLEWWTSLCFFYTKLLSFSIFFSLSFSPKFSKNCFWYIVCNSY